MEHRFTDIKGLAVRATDGDIGSVTDVYFDDARWGVRYLVVDTGRWLPGRKVLISPRSLRPGGVSGGALAVELTREQVKNSPQMDEARPVSRHYEVAHSMYYGYPYYWTGPYLWGMGAYPLVQGARNPALGPNDETLSASAEAEKAEAERSHLRSAAEVVGYGIEARDGSIGHLQDLVIDDENWGIPSLVVDKRAWLPGGHVLVPPEAVADIDWTKSSMQLNLTRDAIKHSPATD